MDGDAERFEHRRGLMRKAGRVHPCDGRGHRQVLGKRTVDVDARVAGVLAKVGASEPAGPAAAAKDVTFEAYPIAGRKAFDPRTGGFDGARDLMPEDPRQDDPARHARRPVVDLHVGAADPGRADPDQ